MEISNIFKILDQGRASKKFRGSQNLAREPQSRYSKIWTFNLYVNFVDLNFFKGARRQPLAQACFKLYKKLLISYFHKFTIVLKPEVHFLVLLGTKKMKLYL